MTYKQVLLTHGGFSQLIWIPEIYAQKKTMIKIKNSKGWEEFYVMNVFEGGLDEYIEENGKTIWYGQTPELTGEKLQERLRLYSRMKKENEVQYA